MNVPVSFKIESGVVKQDLELKEYDERKIITLLEGQPVKITIDELYVGENPLANVVSVPPNVYRTSIIFSG